MSLSVRICAIGDFGRVIAAYLQLYVPELERTESSSLTSLMSTSLPFSHIHILAVTTQEISVCAEATRRFYANSDMFVPVVLRSSAISVGPVNGKQTPGTCWNCAERRNKQHQHAAPGVGAATNLVTKCDSFQIFGLSHCALLLVASGLSYLVHESDRGCAPSSFVWHLDLKTGNCGGNEVDGIHQCPVCGLGRDAADISTKQLSEDLSYLRDRSRVLGSDI